MDSAAATGRDAAWSGRSTGRRGYSWPASWSARSPTSGWRRIRLSSLAAAAFAAALALMGCQPVATVPKPARGGTAVEALVGQATVLNPLFESNESTRDVDSLIYQGLTAVDSQQNVVGVLARDWAVSPDHLTYTVNVRDDVKWGDGEPFGADDGLFTFHVLQDLEYQQPGAEIWRQVGVTAGRQGQVVFALRAPDASFPVSLRVGIIPKHIFKGMAPDQIASSPNSAVRAFGTGPFKVGSISPLAITLDRNPYAAPQPYLDHLVLRTYRSEEHTSELQSRLHLVCRLLLEKKKNNTPSITVIMSTVREL